MKKWIPWVVGVIVLAALAGLIGWARSYVSPLTPRASEAWSRGRLLGSTPINVRVDAQYGPDGDVYLAWGGTDKLVYVARIGERGQVRMNRKPDLGSTVAQEPQLLLGSDGEIHLVWLDAVGRHSTLTYARLDQSTNVLTPPYTLSLDDDFAQRPLMAFNRQGDVEVFWVGRAGVYHVGVSAQGERRGRPTLLIEHGEAFSLQVDRDGLFHLAWRRPLRPNVQGLYYATFDPVQGTLAQPEEMAQVFLRAGQSVQSLALGLDRNSGYVIWVVQDLKYVTSEARYAFFPLEIPRQKKVRDLPLEGGSNPLHVWAMRGQYETALLALTGTVMTTDGVQLQVGIMALQGEPSRGDQAWSEAAGRGWRQAAPVRVPRRLPVHQPAAAGLAQVGWPDDQYIVTASGQPSLKPHLFVDPQMNLHLTWLETSGFGTYRIAYASTAAGIKQAYNRTTLWDVTDWVLGMAMQFFAAVGFAPVLVVYWTLLPLLSLLIYLLFTGNESLREPSAKVVFASAVVAEVLFTYLIYPHREMMAPAWSGVAPLLTAAAGLALAMGYLWRRDEKSLFGPFFIFAGVHGMLQVFWFVLVR
jgi:hypothetical protein